MNGIAFFLSTGFSGSVLAGLVKFPFLLFRMKLSRNRFRLFLS